MSALVPSLMDQEFIRMIRGNINAFLRQAAVTYGSGAARLLDIAPQVHEGARAFFPAEVAVETLDIDPHSGCTYIGDICDQNTSIPDDSFDLVVCTEVLEHTLHPFNAVAEMRRMLKPGDRKSVV